jgi:glucokinase
MENDRMNYGSDPRIVLTLDAGGTNMVFSAIRANEEIIEPVTVPTAADNLERCLAGIVDGFSEAMKRAGKKPAAISFAFPGPADYPAGIIGDLGNLPAFRGGVALGPMLGEKFRLPVFINNDGNLFAFGEAIAGFLPWINGKLEEAGSPKRFTTLLGVTLGTGFGGGIVIDGRLHIGDNSSAGEIWLLRHKTEPGRNAEEGASIRGVRRFYAAETGSDPVDAPEPSDIYLIAKGEKEGDRAAAKKAFARMGEIAGDAVANAVTLIDGPVVVGGGLSGAQEFFLPSIVGEMNGVFSAPGGGKFPRLETKAFNLEDPGELSAFIRGGAREIPVPGSGRAVRYDPLLRVGVGITRLGTSRAVGVGAYAFALGALDGR